MYLHTRTSHLFGANHTLELDYTGVCVAATLHIKSWSIRQERRLYRQTF